jgi:preprotein translocase subunit SecG
MYAAKFPLIVIGAILSTFLILIIILRIPKENVGLVSFATKSNILGSPSSAERFLNIATMTGIFLYLGIAFQLNLLYINDYILF